MSTAERRKESMGELVKDLTSDVSDLIRLEIAHARAEMIDKAKEAALGAGMIAGAAVLALGAFGALTALFILLLAEALPAWGAAAVVACVYALVAAVLVQRGRQEISEAAPPVPTDTISSVKEDVQWAKSSATSNGR